MEEHHCTESKGKHAEVFWYNGNPELGDEPGWALKNLRAMQDTDQPIPITFCPFCGVKL